MEEPSLLSLAILLFLIVDPMGSVPAILPLIKDFERKRQLQILFIEAVIALLLALAFQYIGEWFLGLLQIQDYVLRISGGILLLIIAINMIFSGRKTAEGQTGTTGQIPFIFPIATPMLSGPALLTILMVEARIVAPWKLTAALTLAWIGVIAVIAIIPFLQRLLGRAGLAALEQVMGMIVAMIAIEMIINGAKALITA